MNIITYSCGHLIYSDGSTVVSKLTGTFNFDKVIAVESNLNIDRYGKQWQDDKLALVNYHTEVKNFRFGDILLRDMPALSRKIIEDLSLDRCHLYNMHRDEHLTFRRLDREVMDCFQYWNYILDTNKISLFICHGFPHSVYVYALYALCKAKNIDVIYIARSCVPGYVYCDDDIFTGFEKLETAYQKALSAGGSYNFSDYMTNSYIKPMENDNYQWVAIKKESGAGTDKKDSSVSKILRKAGKLFLINRWGQYIKTIKNEHEEKTLPKKTVRYYSKLSGKADLSKRFIYIPLQMQPESTTSPMGNIFVDFVLMVKILADCVRDTDIQLYVKEHPAQRKMYRPSRRQLYDDLAVLPNVKLIDIDESSFKLQDKCIVSATCSGTVVMESLFKYKPVLVFGNRIHNHAPSAIVVSDTASCNDALEKIMSGEFSFGKKERDAFLYAVEQACHRGFWFSRYADRFGLSQDESADNTYSEIAGMINNLRKK